MNKKPSLEEPVRQRVDELLEQSGTLFQTGDRRGSLELALKAWDLIPEPKYRWDYYPQSLAVGFVEDYVELGDAPSAKRWIKEAYAVYGDPNRENLYVLMLEGRALDKLELGSEARAVFERTYQIHGRDGFSGEHLKYFEQYLGSSAASGGNPNLESPADQLLPDESELSPETQEKVDELCEAGNAALDQGDSEGAVARWREALQLVPEHCQKGSAATWLHASIGDEMRVLGRIEDAVAHFRSAAATFDGPTNAFVQFGLGASLYDAARIDDSTEPLLRAYMMEGSSIFEDEDPCYLRHLAASCQGIEVPPEVS